MSRDVEKRLEVGFFKNLTKPIKFNEFTEALDKTLESADAGRDGVDAG